MAWESYDKIKLMMSLMKSTKPLVGEVKLGKSELLMRTVESRLNRTTYSLKGEWDETLASVLASGEVFRAVYFHGGFQFLPCSADEDSDDVEVVDIRKMVVRGREEKIPICVFGEVLTPDINALALYLFGKVDKVTIQSALTWSKDHQKVTRAFNGESKSLRVEDFLMMGPHYSVYGTPSGQAFLHKKVGFISGLSELKELFPNASPGQVRKIYRAFELEPSTKIGSMFKEPVVEDKPEPRKPRKRVKGERSGRGFELNDLIRKFNIHSDPDLQRIYFDDPKLGFRIVSSDRGTLHKHLQESGVNLDPDEFMNLWEMHKSGELLQKGD